MIDAELARFLGEGLGIHIGTRDKELQPNGARVTAIKVEGDGTHVIAYVPQVAAPRVLRDLSNGPVAVRVCPSRRRSGVPAERRVCRSAARYG
jgi:hypothetical protein